MSIARDDSLTSAGLDRRLLRGLHRWRNRWRSRGAVMGLCWTVSALGVALLAAALVDRFSFLGVSQRESLFFAVIAGPVAVALVSVFRLVGGSRSDVELASLVEKRCPEGRGLLRSAVELRARLDRSAGDSLALRAAVQHRAGALAERIPAGRIFPFAGAALRWSAGVLGVVALTHVLAAALPALGYWASVRRVLEPRGDFPRAATVRIDLRPSGEIRLPWGTDLGIVAEVSGRSEGDVAELLWSPLTDDPAETRREVGRWTAVPMEMRGEPSDSASGGAVRFEGAIGAVERSLRVKVRCGDGESLRLNVHVVPRPIVIAFHKTYHPPPYLQDEPRRVREETGELRGLAGGRVDVTFEASEDLRGAEFELRLEDDPPRLVSLAVQGREARLEGLNLERPGSYRVRVQAAETGFESLWSPAQPIRIEVDRPPAVTLVEPRRQGSVRRDALIHCVLQVEDDLGVGAVLERVAVNGGIPERREFRDGVSGTSLRWQHGLDLLPLGLKRGDRLLVSYSVRDLAGNEVSTPTLEWAVRGDEAPPVDRAVISALRELSAGIRSQAREASKLLRELRRFQGEWRAPLSRAEKPPVESVEEARRALAALQDWLGRGEALLRRLESGVEMADRVEVREDLLLIYSALNALLADRARPAVLLLGELLDHLSDEPPSSAPPIQRTDRILNATVSSWSGVFRGSDRLAGDVLGIRVQIELESRLLGGVAPLAAWLDTLESAFENPFAVPQSEFERLLRERSLIAEQFHRLTRVYEPIPQSFLAAENDPELERQSKIVQDGVESLVAAFASLRGGDDHEGWQKIRDAANRFVVSARPLTRRLDETSEEARGRLRSPASTVSGLLAAFARGAAPYRSACEEFSREIASRVEELAPDRAALRALLRRLVQPAEPARIDARGRLRIDLLVRYLSDALRIADRHASYDSRFAADLALLERIVESVDLAQPWRSRWAVLRDARDPAADLEASVKDYLARLETQPDRSLAELETLSGAFSKLELSRDLGVLAARAREFADRENRPREEGAASVSSPADFDCFDRFDHFDHFVHACDRLRRAARDRSVADLEVELGHIVDSIEFEEAGQVLGRLSGGDAREGDAPLLRLVFSRIHRRLENLHRVETPLLREAREVLRSRAPRLAEQIAAALELSTRVFEEGRARRAELDGENVDLASIGERIEQQLYESEKAAADAVASVRHRMIREASALDLSNPDAVALARDLDVAVLVLREPSPAAEDFIIAAAGTVEDDVRKRALDRAIDLQGARVATLRRLLERFEGDETDRRGRDLRSLESELGIAGEMEERYRRLQALSGLHAGESDQAGKSGALAARQERGEAVRGELRKGIDDQAALQESLADLVQQSPRALEAVRELLRRLLDRVRSELGSAIDDRGALADRWRQAVLEARAQRDRLRREISETLDVHLPRLRQELEHWSALELRSTIADREEEREILQERLNEAVEDLRRARDTFDADAAGALERLEQAARAVDGGVEASTRLMHRLEAAVPRGSTIPGETGSRALALVDRLRHEVRRLSRQQVTIEAQRQAEDRATTEAVEAGESRLAEIDEFRQGRKKESEVDPTRLADEERELREGLRALAEEREDSIARRRREDLRSRRRVEALARDAVSAARELASLSEKRPASATVLNGVADRMAQAAGFLELGLQAGALDSAGTAFDAALQELGVKRDEAAVWIDATAMLSLEFRDAGARLREMSAEVGRLSGRSRHRRSELARSEAASRASLEATTSRLERCVDYARQTGGISPEAVERAAVALRSTALPGVDAIIQRVAAQSRGGLLELEHDAIDEIDADARGVLESLRTALAILKEDANPRERGPTGSSADADARTAPYEAEALEAMKRALQALAKGDLSGAEQRQRGAAEALARAAHAAAEGLSRDRRQGESDENAPRDADSEASGSEPGDSVRGGSPDAGSPMPSEGDDSPGDSLVERLLDGKGADDLWARLPSRLKRELLHAHREGVPERYRGRVEAYFRALAEASGR